MEVVRATAPLERLIAEQTAVMRQVLEELIAIKQRLPRLPEPEESQRAVNRILLDEQDRGKRQD